MQIGVGRRRNTKCDLLFGVQYGSLKREQQHFLSLLYPTTDLCGQGNNADQLRPTQVPSFLGTSVQKIAAGLWHTLCVTVNGQIYAFGGNQFGQLGTGSDQPELSTFVICSVDVDKVVELHAMQLDETRSPRESVQRHMEHPISSIKGLAQKKQIGRSNASGLRDLVTKLRNISEWYGSKLATCLRKTSPRQLDASRFENRHSSIVSCGARHSALLTADGHLFTWGWNKYGQLGLGDSADRNIPGKVSIAGCRARNVACGWWHTLLLVYKTD
ncbi:hypothetical protein VNO80_07214 [Phaseolus coccineus]|uniref:Uncharacterized protein n=1 Tax=Phaseolus coccineus TaxID=3886 RepID=A0AAN9NNQ1_PHACN